MNTNREPRIESQDSGKKHLTPHGSITTRTNTQTITRIPQTNLTTILHPLRTLTIRASPRPRAPPPLDEPGRRSITAMGRGVVGAAGLCTFSLFVLERVGRADSRSREARKGVAALNRSAAC